MEKTNLKLDHIRLTPEIVETINSFQAGGTLSWDHAPSAEHFDNYNIKDILQELTDLNDFVVEIYALQPSPLEDEKKYFKHLMVIRDLKNYIKSFMAPVETEPKS